MTKTIQYKNGKTRNRLFMTISLAAVLAVTVSVIASTEHVNALPTDEKPYVKFFGLV